MDPATLNALAEPKRLQMIELLRNGPMTVGEIAIRLRLRQPQASKHLKVLRDAGLVDILPEGVRRYHRLNPEPLQAIDEWLESFRGMWEGRFDRLADYLNEWIRTGHPPS